MAGMALRHEVDELRDYMKELCYQTMRTEMSLNRLSEEMREFKDEMKVRSPDLPEFSVTLVQKNGGPAHQRHGGG